MKKKQSTSKSNYYKLNKPMPKAQVVKAIVEVRKPVPIPPGIHRAIDAKDRLLVDLKQMTNQPVTTSIDVQDGKYVLVVRGTEVPFAYYDEYEIVVKSSILIRDPPRKK